MRTHGSDETNVCFSDLLDLVGIVCILYVCSKWSCISTQKATENVAFIQILGKFEVLLFKWT